jgi:uncharacterized protein YPO0396
MYIFAALAYNFFMSVFDELIPKKRASHAKLESELEDAEIAFAKAEKKLRDKRAAIETRNTELIRLEALEKQYTAMSERYTEILEIQRQRIENEEWDEDNASWLPHDLDAEKKKLQRLLDEIPGRARKIYYNR